MSSHSHSSSGAFGGSSHGQHPVPAVNTKQGLVNPYTSRNPYASKPIPQTRQYEGHHPPLSPYWDQDHSQHFQNHDGHEEGSTFYAPHEPTPPDSGRSKTIREYDLNRLDMHGQQSSGMREHDAQQSRQFYRHPPSSAGTEHSPLGGPDADAGRAKGSSSQEDDTIAAAADADEVENMGAHHEHQQRPQLLDWQSDDDTGGEDEGSFVAEASVRHASYAAAPRSSAVAMHRASSRHSSSSSQSSCSSSTFSSPPRRRMGVNNKHGGDVRWQIPIRDTPNNPFLHTAQDNDHHTDDPYLNAQARRRRTGRGEDAARAQNHGYLACVFRGQRILQLDVPSDDSDDEDPFSNGPSRGAGRLQPKLLFPEAHAQEARRQRQRQLDEQALQRRQRAEMARMRISQASASSSRAFDTLRQSASSASSRHQGPGIGSSLFAAQIRHRDSHNQRGGVVADREVRPRQQSSRSMSSRQIQEFDQHEMQHARPYPAPSRADPRLLATLDRAGWDSDECDEDDSDNAHHASITYEGENSDSDVENDSARAQGTANPYNTCGYRHPPRPEDYDREREQREEQQRRALEREQQEEQQRWRAAEVPACSHRDEEEDSFWSGASSNARRTDARPIKPLRRSSTLRNIPITGQGEGQQPQRGPFYSSLARSQSQSFIQQAHGVAAQAHARPALTSRMTIHSTNKRMWDADGRQAQPRNEEDDPFHSRPNAAARQSRSSMHNGHGMPICPLPSRSASSRDIASLPSSSHSMTASASANPFDLHFLAAGRH